jgi:uncharacterized membrane protein
MFPPVPTWEGLHPLIIHFPIALLLIVPLFVIGALVFRKHSRTLMFVSFALMVLGTVAAFVAVSTGEAAGELADRLPGVNAVLERHEDLAELTRNVFTGLTLAFGAILLLPRFLKKDGTGVVAKVVTVVFLGFYMAGVVLLANTAHQGGQLVHTFGVRAMVPADPGNDVTAEASRRASDDDD